MFFKKGTVVEVVSIDENDRMLDIAVGDLFMVIEDDSPIPTCTPLNSECFLKEYSFTDSQLKEYKR